MSYVTKHIYSSYLKLIDYRNGPWVEEEDQRIARYLRRRDIRILLDRGPATGAIFAHIIIPKNSHYYYAKPRSAMPSFTFEGIKLHVIRDHLWIRGREYPHIKMWTIVPNLLTEYLPGLKDMNKLHAAQYQDMNYKQKAASYVAKRILKSLEDDPSEKDKIKEAYDRIVKDPNNKASQ